METPPKIGERIKVKRWHRYYPLTGMVTAIFPVPDYDVANPQWNDPDFDPPSIGLKPERDWLVSVKVDRKPANWDYFDSDTFQPMVNEIEPA